MITIRNERWQPIETAPTGPGKFPILAYAPHASEHKRIQAVWWHQPTNPEASGLWVSEYGTGPKPTHWRPLPEPPA